MRVDHQSTFLATPPANGQSLRCAFEKSGDRFRHTIELASDGDMIPILSSAACMTDEPWPASPPWQELHVHEQLDGSSALMLVGRAGKSHWSMSVTVDDESPAIVFDVACRIRETPAFLGSTYEDHRGTGLHPVQIAALSLDGLETRPTVESIEGRVVVDATQGTQPPATLRWRYAVAFDH